MQKSSRRPRQLSLFPKLKLQLVKPTKTPLTPEQLNQRLKNLHNNFSQPSEPKETKPLKPIKLPLFPSHTHLPTTKTTEAHWQKVLQMESLLSQLSIPKISRSFSLQDFFNKTYPSLYSVFRLFSLYPKSRETQLAKDFNNYLNLKHKQPYENLKSTLFSCFNYKNKKRKNPIPKNQLFQALNTAISIYKAYLSPDFRDYNWATTRPPKKY